MDWRENIGVVDQEPPFLSKDYERMVQSSETLIEVSMIRLMLRRLARGASTLPNTL